MKKRIGLIGLGDIAQKVYLPLLSANEQVDIVGISSRTKATVERIAEQYRIKGRCETVDQLLATKPDAVFIHSPTETHFDVVMACLRHGVSVYVDKPLSYQLAESEQMARFAQAQGLLLAVGFNRRFAPMYEKARLWMNDKEGFDLCSVQKHRTKLQSHDSKKTLYDDLIHMLDLLLWLGGDDYQVGSYMEQVDGDGRLVLGLGSLTFTNESRSGFGGQGQFSMARRAGTDLEKLELHGSFRSVEVLNMESAILSDKNGLPLKAEFGSWDTILHRRGFAGVVEHFLYSLEHPEACTVRAERVLPVHELVERLNNY